MANAMLRMLVGVGTLVGSIILGAAVVRADGSSPHNYPPIDPARVECTAFRPAHDALCYTTANDLYQLNELILDQFEADDVTTAIQETLPTTPQVFPDGTVVYGVEGALTMIAAWAGSNDFTFGPSPTHSGTGR